MKGPYDDIIDLPRHVSITHSQMPVANRAAQFSPFAALTGYDAAIDETARQTGRRIELDENALAALDMKLSMLSDMIADHPEVAITHFQPDEKKEGGVYVTTTGVVRKIDDHVGFITLTGGEKIMIADVLDIECELFGIML